MYSSLVVYLVIALLLRQGEPVAAFLAPGGARWGWRQPQPSSYPLSRNTANAANTQNTAGAPSATALYAAAGNKKRRRRRKAADPVKQDVDSLEDEDTAELDEMISEKQQLNVEESTEAAGFEFQPPATADSMAAVPSPPVAPEAGTPSSTTSTTDGQIPLPDIRDTLRRKELQQKIAQMEADEETKKVRIKRSDKEAFAKLLEQSPFSDADDSLFEEEAYGTVSALLGERVKPFLGIPTGPLQAGHLIGALGIILMAFVEYPGFPLTNLPTPIRDALQGGLGTVFAINIVLAVFSVFEAQKRGQSIPLWAAKTFAVGGIAYDQLTQLPTTEETERAQAVKGARSLKKNR